MMLIGKKIGMTQMFEASGKVVPVSVIEAGPCPIVQVKTAEKEGYTAIQIGFDEVKESRMSKAENGHCKKANTATRRILREVRVDDAGNFKVGDTLDVKLFEGAKIVHVTGTSKGKGFAGTIRRYHFQRGRKTHGNKNYREPGSVGASAFPSRIFPGKRAPGRMGGVQRTTRNLTLVQIDAENNLLFIKGSIPGANNGIVFVRTEG
ncbi:MAG TPA: 50S ribosomal protein L3 [Vicinamibacterales bacterium]|jgi:large subunit ribosomal protein L3|nr:50S ribosomal protein L3 [Vicinamibacterales bacterium]